ncbi:MAG: serine dehydratase [Planctomycetaceae bacterium]|nr:serine dehydratase [Planctomycetaceae bacterium]
MTLSVDLADVVEAHRRIRSHIHRTPVMTCRQLDQQVGTRLFFKCENLQKAGAFKSRGACNAVFSLSDEVAQRGFVTHSSGNHAAALARAAARRGVSAQIVMPSNSSGVKIAAVKGYGAAITFCEPNLPAREAAAAELLEASGGTLIHPYDDEAIIAGQGTAAVELLEEVPDLDLIVAPVGGGGLLAGTLIAAKAIQPAVQVIAVEPLGADDAYRSWKSGTWVPSVAPQTVADGLLTSLGTRNFAIIRELVDDIWRVEDAVILRAMQLILERAKLVVEPSAAVPLAGLLEPPAAARTEGKRVGVLLSGGNVDLQRLPLPSTV